MPDAEATAQLEQLLQHPALWRGRSVAPLATFASGFAALDRVLPGGGWPRSGLIEILTARQGIGELQLWLPALAALSSAGQARWCAFVGPPFPLFAPAFAAAGVQLEQLLVIRPEQVLWATEQALLSGACDIVLAWVAQGSARDLRRLALATEQGRSAAVIFRPLTAEHESSPALLRIAVHAIPQGLRLRVLKSRSSQRDSITLVFTP
jgi:cell division inhibitor SulA